MFGHVCNFGGGRAPTGGMSDVGAAVEPKPSSVISLTLSLFSAALLQVNYISIQPAAVNIN